MKKELFATMYELLAKKGIAGVSFGNPEVRVYVESWSDAWRVPEKILGYETKVIVSGRFKTLVSKYAKRTRRFFPVPGGVSCSHEKGFPGTLGGVVEWRGKKVWITNNHVAALSNNAKIGDKIYQPAKQYGGRPVGRLVYFNKIDPNGVNTVDVALVEPLNSMLISDEIVDVGKISGLGPASVGLEVMKQGMNCLTEGKIVDVGATIKVWGFPWGYSIFADQIITTGMAEAGDSGSILLDKKRRMVGLIFSGSPKYTAANRVENIVSATGISLPGAAPRGAIALLALAPLLILLHRQLRTR